MEIPSSLPPALQRLFLPPWPQLFRLAMLMGFAAEMSSEILSLDRDEVDQARYRALSDLLRLVDVQRPIGCS